MRYNYSCGPAEKLCSIVIVNYNAVTFLGACLSSLQRARPQDFEVIVVDNASSDGSVDFVRAAFPIVTVIPSVENLGFAGGCNLGEKYAAGKYLVFLSPDVVVDEHFLSFLLATAHNPEVGVAGSRLNHLFAPGIVDAVGFDCDILGFPRARMNGEPNAKVPASGPIEVFAAVGAAMLITHGLFRELGGFDERHFLTMEDIDLCWRARLLGYRVVIDPRSLVYHASGASFRKMKTTRSYVRFLNERNNMRNLLKNYSTATLVAITPIYALVILAESYIYLLFRRWDMMRSIVKAIIWNIGHLPGTYVYRRHIQRTRVVTDGYIMHYMSKRFLKFYFFLRREQILREYELS